MKNLLFELNNLFKRDLSRLESDIEHIPESYLWKTKGGITNSCGVLAQHILGNLNHYIGTVLGNTGFERDREKEFTNTGKSASELIEEVKQTKSTITHVLPGLDEETLLSPYPMDISYDYSVYQFLVHLYGHLNYHLGQINYLRRMLSKNKG